MAGFKDGFDSVKKIAEDSGVTAGEADSNLVLDFLSIFVQFVGVIALSVLIIGGVMYILAFGNEEKAKTAKRLILYAIIGLLVIGASGLIVNLIISLYV